MISDAEDAVTEWREHLREIVSLHVNPNDDVNWREIRDRPEPIAPSRSNTEESAAQSQLEGYEPRFFDFLYGGSEKRRARLADAVVEARQRDETEFRKRLAQHEQDHADWLADKELARRLLSGDVSAERDVISEMKSWSDEGLIGTRLAFCFSDEYIHAIAYVHNDEVVPKVRRKQLQSGRLSETKMPVAEANELYQDYVCSVALKVAGDLFGVLPRDEVFVTCCAKMLDTTTGRTADTPILSVRFIRETFANLRLAAIDPSDSMRNFVHEMRFKRTKGFDPIEPLKPLEGE
ncbi:hypothetical protein [Croceibacterium aestuarii]|uniref:hypothetical protein n=1 Tax=Croceibacterium aestuarii TaxID=3064139 RepID=UPI00272DCF79|nr:hypothetical protein [Croceibacterium sp. D39]